MRNREGQLTDFEEEEELYEGESFWVIPHRSSLDYCCVVITSTGPDKHGRVFVEGVRSQGWVIDHARIKTRVPLNKLTKTPSWHMDFKDLYDDPCIPERRHR